MKEEIPYQSPVDPVELSNNDKFQFNCRPCTCCFNEYYQNIDIVIPPYNILRLKKCLKMSSSQWVNGCTSSFSMDQHQLSERKLASHDGTKACAFMEAIAVRRNKH